MAVHSSGTQIATVDTEHILASPTTDGTYQLVVDLSDMASGDFVELRIKRKVLTGGTVATYQKATFGFGTSEPVVISPPVYSPYGVTVTLLQTDGVSADFKWSLETL